MTEEKFPISGFRRIPNIRSFLAEQILDADGEVICTIVDADENYLRMSKVSLTDHLTEPRDYSSYSVRASDVSEMKDVGLYCLCREINPGNRFILGFFPSEEDADKALAFLRKH